MTLPHPEPKIGASQPKPRPRSSHDMPDTVSLPAPWQIKEAVQILGASKTYLEPIQTALYDHRGVKSQIRFEVPGALAM